MKNLFTVALSLLFVVGLSGVAVSGSLDSPGALSAGSGMYTLQNLYDYLTSGTALTVQTSFQEPTSGPGSTMKTTKEIGDGVQALFAQCPATAADVKSGVKFFSTVSGSWGVQTGTGLMQPTATATATPSPTQTPSPTPTGAWNQATCEGPLFNGYWANKNNGSGFGCWEFANASQQGQSCDTVCAAAGLACDPDITWNYNTTCDVCHHVWVGLACSGNAAGPQNPTWYDDLPHCYYRGGTGGQACAYTEVKSRRLCVCR